MVALAVFKEGILLVLKKAGKKAYPAQMII